MAKQKTKFGWFTILEREKEEKWLKLFDEWKAYVDPIYAQLRYGDANYLTILEDVYNEVYKNPNARFSDTYKNFQENCAFRNDYKTYIPKIDKLDGILHFEDVEATPATPAA
jgi:hypothetical protein